MLVGDCSLARHGHAGPAAPLRRTRPRTPENTGSRERGLGVGGSSVGLLTARRPCAGWVAGALPGGEGRDLAFPGAASRAAPPGPVGPAARRVGTGVSRGDTSDVSAPVRGILAVGHEEDKTRVPRAEVPVGLVLCVLDLCFSLSAEIRMTMCCGAFLKQ